MIILIIIAALIVLGDVAAGPLGIGSLIIGLVSLGFFWLATGHDERSPWTVDEGEDPSIEAEDADVPDTPLRTLWWRVFYNARPVTHCRRPATR